MIKNCKCDKKRSLKNLSAVFITVIGFDLFFFLNFFCFIPSLNNLFIIMAILCIGFGIIYLSVSFGKSKPKKSVKIFLMIVLSILISLVCISVLIFAVFNFKNYCTFKCNGKTYYYEDVGWNDPAYNIYEKYGKFRLNKIQFYCDIVFPKEIDGKTAEQIVSGNYKKAKAAEAVDNIEKSKAKVSDFEKTPQTLIDEKILLNDVIRIPNSPFGVVLVDRAMHRNRWFFVKLSEDRPIYISEIPETAELEVGKALSSENIRLKFKDVNGNISEYKSSDGGKNWEEIKSGY